MWEKMWKMSALCDGAGPQREAPVRGETAGLLTAFLPRAEQETGESGLVHPGVGLTKELLENVQKQVRDGAEPWSTYFAEMTVSRAADREPEICLTEPEKAAFDSQKVNGWFIRDSLTAYTQAILYFVTGDNAYRRNAVRIFRMWSGLEPERFAYFTDACIHAGIPMHRMCMGAEIIRYSSWRVTPGYAEAELDWTKEDHLRLGERLVRPALDTFLSSCNEFMNQHLYTTIGAMSGYLFLDDREGYAKTVEWFTVNKEGNNPGFNGSIKRLFRRISTIDQVGEAEGSGEPLPAPVIQHVEMGRDQAHGCGDLTNAVILARLMAAQKTRVDPNEGTISEAEDAVEVYAFLEDRILKAADFFLRYMLGYSVDWVPVPFSIRDGKIIDNYEICSPAYRGRYNTMNFWDLYVYYTMNRPQVHLAEEYPYFFEGFLKKVPSNYYNRGRLIINWENADGGGDFWMFLPPEMAGDPRLLARPQKHYLVEAEDRGVMVENREAMFSVREGETGFIRFVKSPRRSRLAITTGGTDRKNVAFRIRTDGPARLTVIGEGKGSIRLPDTQNRWEYVRFADSGVCLGDLYYLEFWELEGNYVDLDAIDIKPEEGNEDRGPIAMVEFQGGSGELSCVSYRGASVRMEFPAETTAENPEISYRGVGLPEGASLEEEKGLFLWKPDRSGSFSFSVEARSENTCAVKEIRIEVAEDRNAARKLEEAAENLQPVSPRLKDDPYTDGTSLDYPRMVQDSSFGKEIRFLTDGQGTFCSNGTAVEGAHILDFGADLQVSVSRFGFRARPGFSDRLAGVQVFGSNDRADWKRLTEKEAAFTQKYQEVEVRAEERENRYRYLKLCKTTEYPDALRGEIHRLLEFSELRIYGNAYKKEGNGD